MTSLPRNSQGLVDLRSRGVAPELPVLISLIGDPGFTNLTLYADPGASYDWRCIAALDIEVFASSKVAFSDLLATLRDLAAAVPRHMVLTFIEGPRVDCGEMRTLIDFALFDWFPMAIGPNAYLEGGIIARKIFAALGKELPIPYDEACALLPAALQEGQCD